ncbi:two-component system sensor histidine kinase KdpD [Rhodococcus sp. PvR044]|uniref:sensor histidine kinase n=1 Tax=unclassified Rhodococcus (in: high G+C Gram-positive bacteria) TaxID=192944 RepID=UPI000BCFB6A3|nr:MULTISPECIES: DUF4118 domain-containing protein [unclassified Rhodococcus (in: high G+C Gram-positive bacteria)]PTR43565.1 osmosensitive K+ channel signal transduction histidine kinase [Rhodococcus sp. OK611]SNX90910.1 osmosensitive K+ channel signal transduction histidine kinase [Rhodococcus sp. OK270]
MRGTLRIYLGAAPGVGKTYAMLGEGRRRRDRGTDVVIGYVACHGRPRTLEMVDDLEVVPTKAMTYRGATFTEMDTEAVIARTPRVALVDELAHTNVPGSSHDKRWQDIEDLLDAGIDVVSTVNIQHLESLNDVVEQITGIPQRETVPDEVVRRADQVELVDMAPEALRRRMAHGNVYPPERVGAALSNYFRVGNLTALRELAMLWLADKVDDQLDRYRADHHITGTWEARERVVVGLTGGPEGETLIRRAARIADRSKGADLFAIHITPSDGLAGANPAHLARQRALVESLGGTFHHVVGDNVPDALLEFARGVNATQLVLGASRRGRLAQIFSRGVGVEVTALSGSIDVHMVTHEATKQGRAQRLSALTRLRRVAGFVLAVVGMPLLAVVLANLRGHLSLPSDILLFLLGVVGVALVGGLWPALVAALLGSALLNYYFTPPIYEFTIAEAQNALALIAYVVIAIAVSAVVDLAARRTRDAAQASANAAVLANLSGSVLRGEKALSAILDRLRETYALTSVTLLERPPDTPLTPARQQEPARWRVAATVGGEPCLSPDDGDMVVAVDDDLSLALRGRTLPAADRQVLEAFAAQAAVALRQQRLADEAEHARPLAEADRMRTALLEAVGHDLRTSSASATSAIERLRHADGNRTAADRDELLATAAVSLKRLDHLSATLVEMGRPRAGGLGTAVQPVALDDAIPRVFDAIGAGADRIRVQIAEELPAVLADPGLLERVLVDLIAHALHRTPPGEDVLVAASVFGDIVELRVIDHGPDLPVDADRDPLGLPAPEPDGENDRRVDLGLAVAESLAEAMGGSIVPTDTPGGGVTMIITLPAEETVTRDRPRDPA